MKKITILVDNDKSWIHPFVKQLIFQFNKMGNKVILINNYKNIKNGDICFFLGCSKIVPKEYLKKNKHNLVVHESELPSGRGFSPVTWQILEGKNKIPICLIEAEEKVDSGKVYFKDYVKFEGDELINEIRKKVGNKTIELCIKFINKYPIIDGKEQKGIVTFYKRRTPKDSEINPNKSIMKQFNQFRIADNERYPIFFFYNNHKYILKIYKGDS